VKSANRSSSSSTAAAAAAHVNTHPIIYELANRCQQEVKVIVSRDNAQRCGVGRDVRCAMCEMMCQYFYLVEGLSILLLIFVCRN
jgi:hypothetical protein